MARPLGLAALTVLELSPPDMVSCAADAGYACVGLRLVPPTATEPTWPIVGDTAMVREVLRRLADTGVRVNDIEILKVAPDTDVRAWLPVLETGARFGAANVLIASYDPDEARFADKFAALCDLGAPLGLAMNLEPMPWTHAPDLQTATRLAARAARDNAAVLIDPIHFDRAGNVPADIAMVPRSRLRYLQLCDAPAERPRDTEGLLHQARAERLMPGDGGLDLAGIVRAVPADLPIAVEIPMETLKKTVPAVERATRMRLKTEALLASLDAKATT